MWLLQATVEKIYNVLLFTNGGWMIDQALVCALLAFLSFQISTDLPFYYVEGGSSGELFYLGTIRRTCFFRLYFICISHVNKRKNCNFEKNLRSTWETPIS